MKLLIATRNQHKLREIREIFSLPGLEIVSVSDYTDLPEVEEDGSTFAENAAKKAVTLAHIAGVWTLADDSGLVVDALDGAPGIYSARFAGPAAGAEENNAKLLKSLKNTDVRTARFVCAMALCAPEQGEVMLVEGRCEGRIISEGRGAGGFGYDPLFIPEGYEQTFAELGSEIKNCISHRAQALVKAREAWAHLLASE